MWAFLCLLLAVACARADESEDRRSKLPYIADAVGNTLPPPSNGPATVGSPVNLLTPDRYEFYTFDESGELVKRLMTLEEIQAIVAAGEETEGLVTFANENQPTIAFNFSQPPYTKVHSVVTNVQNVLKAQMEAHKNKPLTQPTLDTPDVSDSWSLILPSIFGNTGVDIVPDKTSSTFTTPETETIEIDNSLSKEGSNQIVSSSSTNIIDDLKDIPITEKMPALISTTEKITTSSTTISTSSTSTTTTPKPFTTTKTTTKSSATAKVTTTTNKPTTAKRATSTTTTTTTVLPRTTSTTAKPRTTTTIAKTTTKAVQTTPKFTTDRPSLTTRQTSTTYKDNDGNFTRIQTFTNTASTTIKPTVQYDKFSTITPLSTAAYITERATTKPAQTTRSPIQITREPVQKPSSTVHSTRPSVQTTRPLVQTTSPPVQTKKVSVHTTRPPILSSTTKRSVAGTTKGTSTTTTKAMPSATTYKPIISTSVYISSTNKEVKEKFNSTTVTTQSVSPSTTVSSTENVSAGQFRPTEKKPSSDVKENVPDVNIFDISQSISQIASDLGGNFRPVPTSSDLVDTTRFSEINLESKENVEIEIPSENEKETDMKNSQDKDKQTDNFVKISTIEPHPQAENQLELDSNKKLEASHKHPQAENQLELDSNKKLEAKNTTMGSHKAESTTADPVTTTIDPVLSESMGDLLSQVVNEAPQNIINSDKQSTDNNKEITTQTPKISEKEKVSNQTGTTPAGPMVNKAVIASNNITNDIPQVKPELQVSDKVVKKPADQENSDENGELHLKEPVNKIHQKQNIMVKPETSTKEEDKFVDISESKPSTSKPLQYMFENKTETKAEDKNKTTAPFKVNLNSLDKYDKREDLKEKYGENKTTTSSTEAPSKTKPPQRPGPEMKKPESSTSNANKIVLSENNKVANIKDIEKGSEETPLKVDDFKKKFQKVNIDDKELVSDRNNSWKLISTVAPPKGNDISKDKLKNESPENTSDKNIDLDVSKENQGLEVTTKDLNEDIAQFTELCNELAFRYWHTIAESIDKKRSFVLSPYSITSMLAMMFMGARGATSGEMNEILKLDDMVTFNPHFTLKNISDSIETTPSSGVIVSAFVRELFTDRAKGKVLTFYKERAQHFYNGHVEEINFKLISDIIRRRTNLLVKRYTWGKIVEYMKANTITMLPPLAAFAANIFETDCSGSSVEGRDGEMYFVVSPNVRQRRLVPVPAVVYRGGFLAGYDPVLDATAAALGNTNSVISTLFLMPGQQGNVVHADDLEQLEKRLLNSNPTTPIWNRLLRMLLPRIGLELQIPRFSHKSLFNVSTTLKRMGLKELFDPEHADLGGLNGPSKDLYLSDMVQSTTFVTCGEGVIGEQHHIEEYPENLMGPQRRRTSRWAAGWDEPRDYQRAFHDPHDLGDAMHLPLHLRPRQARLPARNAQPARLKFDRPFLYFVRHNPSGMILYVGRYNPRLLP